MEKLLRTTNYLLMVIAVCLVLLVARTYNVDLPTAAQAQVGAPPTTQPQPVYLVYWPDKYQPTRFFHVVGENGVVPTSK